MNHKKLPFRILPLTIILLMFGACTNDSTVIRKEMVELDRAYIPALFYSSHRDSEKSREAITKLQITWERFNANYYRTKSDTAWRNSFENVGGLISRADGLLNTGDNTESAYEALKDIRIIMSALRKRYGLKIFSDYLTDFHQPMEMVALSIKGATAESLTDSTIAKLITVTSEAQDLWAIVDTLYLDSALYGLSSNTLALLQKSIEEETIRLDALEEALKEYHRGNQLDEHESKQTILNRALTIRAPFVKTYNFFGDFQE